MSICSMYILYAWRTRNVYFVLSCLVYLYLYTNCVAFEGQSDSHTDRDSVRVQPHESQDFTLVDSPQAKRYRGH